jgi:hypothetical protein
MLHKVRIYCGSTTLGVLAGVIGTLTFASASWAVETASSLAEIRRLINESKAEQAIVLLEKDSQSLMGNEEYDYLLGVAYLKAGQTGLASFAFERVLMVNPANVDARLKSARISAERADFASTTELLKPLSAQTLSLSQQQEITKIRALLEKTTTESKASVRGYILAGIGWDSNVTSGPNKDELQIPGLNTAPPGLPPTYTSLGTAKQQSDQTGMLETGLSVRKSINQNTWLTGDGNVRLGYNRERKDVTDSYANLNLGILKKVGRDFIGGAVLGQDYLLNNINYRNSLGAKLNWIHALDNQAWLTTYVQQLNFVYPDHEIDNSKRSILGLTHESASADGTKTFLFGVYGGNDVAKDSTKPHFTYNLWGVSVASNIMINKNLSLSGGLMYESHQHTSDDALYSFLRKDAQASAALSADYRMSERWHVIPMYTYTQNTSNTELYAYNRNTFMLQFRWEFDNEKN